MLGAAEMAEATSIAVGLGLEQIDVLWQMGVASFPSNNNQLVIPTFIATKMNAENINDLKNRFR